MKKLILAAAALVAMASCTKDEIPAVATSSTEAKFAAAQIVTRTSGDEWENLDQVGIYMYKAGETDDTYDLARENVLHTADALGNLTLGTGLEPIYYPQDDKVDFYAYYPYQATAATAGYYTADITKQNVLVEDVMNFDQGAVDFMTAVSTEQSKSSADVELDFYHRLAKLTLELTPKEGFDDLTGVKVTLDKMNTEATFSTTTGAMNTVTESTLGSIEFLTTSSTTDTETGYVSAMTVTAIVLPETLASGAELTFYFTEDDIFVAKFPSTPTFSDGKNHTYNVSVGTSAVDFTEGSTIGPWTTDVNEDVLDADELTDIALAGGVYQIYTDKGLEAFAALVNGEAMMAYRLRAA